MLIRSKIMKNLFLSTPSARRATHIAAVAQHIPSISIHALREEGDGISSSVLVCLPKFLSTPSARRATRDQRNFRPIQGFLSTPSARRAT